MNDKIKIFIVSSLEKPIPDVCGGAVETLLTNLIKENEKQKLLQLEIVSTFNSEASTYKYKNCKIHYLYNKTNHRNYFVEFIYFLYFLRVKFLYNRITIKLFNIKNRKRVLNYEIFQVQRLFFKSKSEYILSEGYDELHRLEMVSKKIGIKNCVYHVHYARDYKDIDFKVFPNTIGISDFVLNKWVKNNSAGYTKVIFNCTQLKNKEFNELFKLKLGFNPNDFIIIFAGRIVKSKGIIQLIEAFKEIDNNEFKLLILGDLDSSFGEVSIKNEFAKLCDSDKRIKYVGFVSNDEMANYYSISNVAVVPSLCDEGAGLVAIEAMRFSLPLIITDAGGLPEYVPNDCCIKLNRDAELIKNLKNALLLIYDDKRLALNLGKAGFSYSKQFTISNYYSDFVNYFKELRKFNNE